MAYQPSKENNLLQCKSRDTAYIKILGSDLINYLEHLSLWLGLEENGQLKLGLGREL